MTNKTNPKGATTVAQDESALAKSTAWAWYERGSGSGSGSSSDRRVTREFDARRTKTEPKPSRYKLEAMRNRDIVQEASNARKVSTNTTTRTNSLLDQYEIERISRHLDYYIRGGAAASGGSGGGPAAVKNNKAVVQRRKMGKGFWLGHVPACGSSRDDVVDFAFSRRPEKGHGVAVVEVGGCRPRPWGMRPA